MTLLKLLLKSTLKICKSNSQTWGLHNPENSMGAIGYFMKES